MELKIKFILLSIFIIFLNSCANIKIISHNKEDIFIFKAETRLIDLKKKLLMKNLLVMQIVKKRLEIKV